MPKDNFITNSDEQNAATNQEAETHKHNIPGDDVKDTTAVPAAREKNSKTGDDDISDESVPDQANTGEPE